MAPPVDVAVDRVRTSIAGQLPPEHGGYPTAWHSLANDVTAWTTRTGRVFLSSACRR